MMTDRSRSILGELADYYSRRFAQHGDTPIGVDWNGEQSQKGRFEQLVKIIQQPSGFSVNDLGCGYGALCDYLKLHYADFTYSGSDISGDTIREARTRFSNDASTRFLLASEPPDAADYGIASGVLNLRFRYSDAEWHEHVVATLDVLDRTSRLGFAFNCLTSYSDADKMRDDLYYANPCSLFDLCKRRYSRNVALLHDYDLYDFTILVRKRP